MYSSEVVKELIKSNRVRYSDWAYASIINADVQTKLKLALSAKYVKDLDSILQKIKTDPAEARRMLWNMPSGEWLNLKDARWAEERIRGISSKILSFERGEMEIY